jgi:Tol biopolymer transport system component
LLKNAFGWRGCLVTAALLELTACSAQKETGAASFAVVTEGITLDDVASVQVVVTAPDIATLISADLTRSDSGVWQGSIGGIPAGPARTFTAEAIGVAGDVLFKGVAVADVAANQTVAVVLNLQQALPPSPFKNSVPYFTSLVASTTRIAPGGLVDLAAAATDPDGDPLTYTWSASGGAFQTTDPSGADSGAPARASGPNATWVAPLLEGSYTVTVLGADPNGGAASMGLAIMVSGAVGQTGSVTIEIVLNTAPVVSSMTAAPSPIVGGQPVALAVAASDPDGDALSFAWLSSCAGTFSPDGTVQDPQLTLADGPSPSSCTFTVTVSDPHGAQNTGTLTVHVGGPVVPTVMLMAVSPTSGLVTTKQGGSTTFNVWLKGPPTSEVDVAVTSEDPSEGTVNPASLVFTSDNWSVPQVVTITGAPGIGDQADHDYQVLVGPCMSSDSLFAAIVPVPVSVTNQDPTAFHVSQTTLVSVAVGGGPGDQATQNYKATADGRLIAFTSNATNLVSNDGNSVTDVFVRDMIAGTTTRVSVATDGTEADGVSTLVDLSKDGRYILFNSFADNLVPGDTNTREDVFLHDRLTQETTRLSAAAATAQQSMFDSSGIGISSDGVYVGITSDICGGYSYSVCLLNIQTGEFTPLQFGWNGEISSDDRLVPDGDTLLDLSTGARTQIDVAFDGTNGNGYSNDFHMSSDGRYVVFTSYATNLVAGDTNGAGDVFLRDTIAGTTTRLSVTSTGGQALSGQSYSPRISRDGRYVVFISTAQNLTQDTPQVINPQAFVRDLSTGDTWRPFPRLPPEYIEYCYDAEFSSASSAQTHVLCTSGFPYWVLDLPTRVTGVFGSIFYGDQELETGLFVAGDRYIVFSSTVNRATGESVAVPNLFVEPVPPISQPSF